MTATAVRGVRKGNRQVEAEAAYEEPVAPTGAALAEGFDAEPFQPWAGYEPESFDASPFVAETDAFPHYYHAYLPNLTVRRGRPEGFKFRGGVVRPRTAQEEANVRAYLKNVVPGGDPDRWKGDTLFDQDGNPVEQRCRECGIFTSNLNVMRDHDQHTKHDIPIPRL